MDDEGLAPKFELTHEKTMNLMVVSDDLHKFFHIHPKQVSGHEFKVDVSLPSSSYTAFVDILPVGKDYHIKPTRIQFR